MTYVHPGQPTKFTKEAKEKILSAVRKGAPYVLACNYARITAATFCNWRNRAEIEKIPEYIAFFEDLKEAEGSTALHWLDKIDKAMEDGTWQAAAWKLERRHSKYFSAQAGIIELNERVDKIDAGKKNEEANRQENRCENDQEI